MKNALLSQIKDEFNLNIYEAKVYTALLSRGICSAGELSDISGVPRSRCYDVLEGLEKKGFVFQKIGKPIKYIAHDPNVVLETLKKQADKEARQKIALLRELEESDVLADLQDLYSSGSSHIDPEDVSHIVHGRTNINTFLKERLKGAKHAKIHTDAAGAKRKSKILRKVRGIKATILAPVEEITNSKATIITQTPKMRSVMIDEKESILFTDGVGDDESALWINSAFTQSMLRDLLE